jgi:diguanylate cyclase (GGDEF)-like protein
MGDQNSAASMLRFTLAVACFLAAMAALSGFMGAGTTLSLYLSSAWFVFTASTLLIWPRLSLRGYQIISVAVLSLLIIRWAYSWLFSSPVQVIIGLSTGLLYTPLFMTITTILMSGRGKTICISVGVIMGLLVAVGGSRPELAASYLGDWRLGPLIAAVYTVFGWLLTNWVAERKALSIRTDETEALAKKANTDPLTGINNRRAADSWMKEREDSARRCGVIFIDIDHFKRINDTHGHDIGDKVLVEVAQLMKNSIRNDDFIARWGGEEFVVLLSSVSQEETSGIAEKLRRNIEKISKPDLPSITASLGVSHAPTGRDLSEAIKRADVGLYRAKNEGRNRVEVEQAA